MMDKLTKAQFCTLANRREDIKRKRREIAQYKAERGQDEAEAYGYERNARIRNRLAAGMRY